MNSLGDHFKKKIWGNSSNHPSGALGQRHLELYKVFHKHNPIDNNGKKDHNWIPHCKICSPHNQKTSGSFKAENCSFLKLYLQHATIDQVTSRTKKTVQNRTAFIKVWHFLSFLSLCIFGMQSWEERCPFQPAPTGSSLAIKSKLSLFHPSKIFAFV